MSDDIRAGDVVVCVDASPCRCCGDAYPAKRGSIYRVDAIGTGCNRKSGIFDGLRLAGGPWVTPNHPNAAYLRASRFRKIDAADDQFTREMRALKPLELTPITLTRQADELRARWNANQEKRNDR